MLIVIEIGCTTSNRFGKQLFFFKLLFKLLIVNVYKSSNLFILLMILDLLLLIVSRVLLELSNEINKKDNITKNKIPDLVRRIFLFMRH